MVLVVVVGCGVRLDGSMGFDPIVEKEIRKEINKPKGELTKTDLEKVTRLSLDRNELTEVPKGLEKLTQSRFLGLKNNSGLTKAQIAELKKALPRCNIRSNPTK
jgi:Leucine-rich repeat (LRR) protein